MLPTLLRSPFVSRFALIHSRLPISRSFASGHVWRSTSENQSVPETLSKGEEAIRRKLASRFQPSKLEVQDVSGEDDELRLRDGCFTTSSFLFYSSGGCGTFYAISIASSQFAGLPMVKQHRLVTEELKKEIEGIHGLQVRAAIFNAFIFTLWC